jgi:hypothetical protein
MTRYKAVFSGCRREYAGPADVGCAHAAASTREDVGQQFTKVAQSRLVAPPHLRAAGSAAEGPFGG